VAEINRQTCQVSGVCAKIRSMSADARRPVILHADQEHSGLRLVIFLALFVGLVPGFFIARWLLTTFAPPAVLDYLTFLSCIGAVPPALLLIWGLEKLLKRVWRSGLSLELNQWGIVVHDRRGEGARGQGPGARSEPNAVPSSSLEPGTWNLEPSIRWGGHLSQINWYFRLSGYPRAGQERRVPAKWLCLATELHQDGARLNAFTLMSPERATPFVENPRLAFQRLNPADLYDRSARTRITLPSRPLIPNNVLHSKEGRYWLAERRRWEYGVELTPDDFTTLMQFAQANVRPAADAAPESLSI
jgi:hypothetical protein